MFQFLYTFMHAMLLIFVQLLKKSYERTYHFLFDINYDKRN